MVTSTLRRAALRLEGLNPVWPVVVAAGLRLAWIALCPNEPTSDQAVYHQGASAIAAGQGFVFSNGDPIAFWPVPHILYTGRPK